MMQPTHAGGRRSFLALDEVNMDGSFFAAVLNEESRRYGCLLGSTTTQTIHGSREDSKEEEPGKEKVMTVRDTAFSEAVERDNAKEEEKEQWTVCL